MPKRRAKKVAASKSYWDTLVSPDHRLEVSASPILSDEYRAWLEADLQRLEAAWPHVGAVGLARDRMKRTPLWPSEAEIISAEDEAEATGDAS